jgi:hypothetical protein
MSFGRQISANSSESYEEVERKMQKRLPYLAFSGMISSSLGINITYPIERVKLLKMIQPKFNDMSWL